MLDFLIVGSGLTGATIARELHDAGRKVLVVDRREHQGGNVHDFTRHGIRVHTYGPHYFRTRNERIWEWASRFTGWHIYEPCLQTKVGGILWPWPPHAIDYADRIPAFTGDPANFEVASLAQMPRSLYERFVEPYTAKQWGVDPKTLDASLAGRFEIRTNGDFRLKSHRFQGIPLDGYAAWTAAILDGIPLELGVNAWRHIRADHTIYTGPIDELNGYDLGRLAYRGQHREHTWHAGGLRQPCGQVNNPGRGDHVRTLEWRHMMPDDSGCNGTILTTETPYTPTDPNAYEYPFPDKVNANLYARYRARADADSGITVCGRLGEYRYYDMDQAIGRALRIAQRFTSGDAGAREDAA